MYLSVAFLSDLNAYMCRVMRKPTFYICENKDADQLRDTMNQSYPGSTLIRLRIYVLTQLKWLKKQLKFTRSRNKKQLKPLIRNREKSGAYRVLSLLGSR